ncbi:hypothetical protein QC762_105023 [Podospora pseudocomata]|uniref:Nudix hydrolase domain-containing protein n=1 Tax=Podospora pseudocomata TaxID=2093779 RepID=A0ABR0GSU9_9PEZI|nr:hypothetical protein QC762_105023 [Podospora pseudocomata]
MASTLVPDTSLILAVLKRGNGFMEGDGIKVWQPRQDFPVWRFTILLKRGNQIHPVDSDTVVKCGVVLESTARIFKGDRRLSSFFDFFKAKNVEVQPNNHMQLKSKYCTNPEALNKAIRDIFDAAWRLSGNPFGNLQPMVFPGHTQAPIPTSTCGILPGVKVSCTLVPVLGIPTHFAVLNIWRAPQGDHELLVCRVAGGPKSGGARLAPFFTTNVSALDASPLAALKRIAGDDISRWLFDDNTFFASQDKICSTQIHGPEYGSAREGTVEFSRRYIVDVVLPKHRHVYELGSDVSDLIWLNFQELERELFANSFSPENGLVILDFLLRYHILHNRIEWGFLDEIVARMRYDSSAAQY